MPPADGDAAPAKRSNSPGASLASLALAQAAQRARKWRSRRTRNRRNGRAASAPASACASACASAPGSPAAARRVVQHAAAVHSSPRTAQRPLFALNTDETAETAASMAPSGLTTPPTASAPVSAKERRATLGTAPLRSRSRSPSVSSRFWFRRLSNTLSPSGHGTPPMRFLPWRQDNGDAVAARAAALSAALHAVVPPQSTAEHKNEYVFVSPEMVAGVDGAGASGCASPLPATAACEPLNAEALAALDASDPMVAGHCGADTVVTLPPPKPATSGLAFGLYGGFDDVRLPSADDWSGKGDLEGIMAEYVAPDAAELSLAPAALASYRLGLVLWPAKANPRTHAELIKLYYADTGFQLSKCVALTVRRGTFLLPEDCYRLWPKQAPSLLTPSDFGVVYSLLTRHIQPLSVPEPAQRAALLQEPLSHCSLTDTRRAHSPSPAISRRDSGSLSSTSITRREAVEASQDAAVNDARGPTLGSASGTQGHPSATALGSTSAAAIEPRSCSTSAVQSHNSGSYNYDHSRAHTHGRQSTGRSRGRYRSQSDADADSGASGATVVEEPRTGSDVFPRRNTVTVAEEDTEYLDDFDSPEITSTALNPCSQLSPIFLTPQTSPGLAFAVPVQKSPESARVSPGPRVSPGSYISDASTPTGKLASRLFSASASGQQPKTSRRRARSDTPGYAAPVTTDGSHLRSRSEARESTAAAANGTTVTGTGAMRTVVPAETTKTGETTTIAVTDATTTAAATSDSRRSSSIHSSRSRVIEFAEATGHVTTFSLTEV